MGNTAPLTDLEAILARALAEGQDAPDADTEEQAVDNALHAAFTLRGIIPMLEEHLEVPNSIHAAMSAYDQASWDCTPADPHGGDKYQALVESAVWFLLSVNDLKDPSED